MFISEKLMEIHKSMDKVLTKKQKNDFKNQMEDKAYDLNLDQYIYDACKQMNRRSIIPKTKDNHVGVELEFIGRQEDYVDINMMLMKKGLANNVILGYDVSIIYDDYNGDETGYEIRIIGTEKTIIPIVKKVLNILSWFETYTNDSCGFHVHLDARYRNKVKMYDKLFNLKNLFYKMVDPSRANNDYCFNVDDNDRCYATGGHSDGIEISDMNTVEVRLHHGTLKFEEISNWIRLLLKVVKTSSKKNGKLLKYGIPKFFGTKLTKYVKSQIKKYAA